MRKIIFWTIPVFIIIMGVYLALVLEDAPTKLKLVDCYDRYGNRLIDEVCEEESYVNESTIFLKTIVAVMPIIFFVSLFVAMGETFFRD